MLQSLWLALGLLLILEGVLPFLAPKFWKETMQKVAQQKDSALRIFGLCSMLTGLGLLYLTH